MGGLRLGSELGFLTNKYWVRQKNIPQPVTYSSSYFRVALFLHTYCAFFFFLLFFAKNFNFCPICPQMVSGWSLIGVGCWCFSAAHRLFSPIFGTPHCAADGIFVGSPLQQQFWIFSMYWKFPLLRTGEPPKFHKGFVAYYYTITITVIQPFTRADFVPNQLKYTILF